MIDLDFSTTLNGPLHRPVCVAVSGGGDSVALLRLLADWGKRRLIVCHVDHGLQALSPQWAQGVQNLARELDATFLMRQWQAPKMNSGVSAKARHMRLLMLADMAREAGASVILTGHNYDDCLEAQQMRLLGSNVPSPHAFVAHPLWPEGAGLMISRPLLAIKRQALRDYLATLGQDYIDDPANEAGKTLRSVVRLKMKNEPFDPQFEPCVPVALNVSEGVLLSHSKDHENGHINLSYDGLMAFSPVIQTQIISRCAVVSGGGARIPRRQQIDNLLKEMHTNGASLTLAGAHIRRKGAIIHILPEKDTRRKNMRAAEKKCDISRFYDWRLQVSLGFVKNESQHDDLLRET